MYSAIANVPDLSGNRAVQNARREGSRIQSASPTETRNPLCFGLPRGQSIPRAAARRCITHAGHVGTARNSAPCEWRDSRIEGPPFHHDHRLYGQRLARTLFRLRPGHCTTARSNAGYNRSGPEDSVTRWCSCRFVREGAKWRLKIFIDSAV